jgi:hypothetical protein
MITMFLSQVSRVQTKYFMPIVHCMHVGTSNRGKDKYVFKYTWTMDGCPRISVSGCESKVLTMNGDLIELVLMPVGVWKCI